jgi:hypothetical protein
MTPIIYIIIASQPTSQASKQPAKQASNQPSKQATSQASKQAKPASKQANQPASQPTNNIMAAVSSATTATAATVKQIFEYDGDIISVDLSNVRICPGPCNNTMEEPEPSSIYTTQNIDNNCANEMHYFKPYSGGKYARFCYPINNTQTLILNNLRICASCHRRYLEFSEENCTEELMSDAKIIMKKLEKNLV